jgi:hypothetical protein
MDSIADCYALNVADTATWAYYYPGFPLVRIDRNWAIRAWQTNVPGANTFAVTDNTIALSGVIQRQPDSCVLGDVGDSRIENLRDCRLTAPKGQQLRDAIVVGRGERLNVFSAGKWYQLRLGELPHV